MNARVTLAASGPPDILHLSALLAGLGEDASRRITTLRGRTSDAQVARACIDGGASVLMAIHAPGERMWEAHVVRNAGGAQDWEGVRVRERREIPLRRTMFRNRTPDAVHLARSVAASLGKEALGRFEALNGRLGPDGRIYSVSRPDGQGSDDRIAWQIARHADAVAILRDLLGEGGLRAVRASLSQVLGFDLAGTSGPWSIAAGLTSPEQGLRIGTSRWAWAIEDEGKSERLVRWIADHGGDAAYCGALYDLVRSQAGGGRTIGRAIEIDIVGDRIGGVVAYLGADAVPMQPPAESGQFEECRTWAG